MKLLKAVKTLLFIVLLSGTTVFAQQMQMPQIQPADSVSDAELGQFVDVAMNLQGISMEADQLVIARLEEEGMSTQRFQQIMMAQQDPNQNANVTTEEEEALANMQSFLQEVSMGVQQKQMTAIQNSELSQQRFQSIAAGIQTNKDLAMRFQALTAEMEQAADQ